MVTSVLDSIDAPALSSWLDEHVPELGKGPLEMTLITGGSTNLIILLDRGEAPLVVLRGRLTLERRSDFLEGGGRRVNVAAAQLAAKVHGGVLVFWIVTLPPVELMVAVSPGSVSSMH